MFKKRFYVILFSLLAVLLAFVFCCVFLFSSEISMAYAASTGDTTRSWTADGYTDPVNDLSFDSSFDINDYPRDDSDYNLYVIQLAESDDNEVYLYVYQPYGSTKYDLTALRVTMTNGSTYLDDDGAFVGTYRNYSLTCVGYYERIYKYVVNSLTVSSSKDHGYSIASISRAYNGNIDGTYTGDNTTSYTAISVAQYWDVYVLSDGDKVYICTQDDVIEITPYLSWFRITTYEKAKTSRFWYDWQQYFFIAFDSDIDIDFLYQADVSFSRICCTLYGKYKSKEITEEIHVVDTSLDNSYLQDPLSIKCTDTASRTSKSGKKTVQTFTFDCIKPAPDFLDYVESTVKAETDTTLTYSELNDDVVQLLQDYQYCIIFSSYSGYAEDDTITGDGKNDINGYCELVQDVQIMRLIYSVDDEMYDVGVVSDTVNPNSNGKSGGALDIVLENEDAKAEKASRNFWRTFLIVLLVVVIVLVIWYCVKRHRDKKRMEKRLKDKNDRNNRNGGGSGGGGSSLPPPAPPPVDSGGSVPALPSGSSSDSALGSVSGLVGSMSSEDVSNLIKAVEVASKFI